MMTMKAQNVTLSEIIVILLVALLVIKPAQLPEVAYTLARWIQWVRRSLGKVKGEMNTLMNSLEHLDDRKSK